MNRSSFSLGILLLAGALGCLKPEPVIFRVSLGMTEEKLLEAVGPPLSMTETGEIKTLEFRTWGSDSHGRPAHPEDWFVHLVGGKVSDYGRHKKPRPSASDAPKPNA